LKKTIFYSLMKLSLSVILVSSFVLGVIYFAQIGRYVKSSRTSILLANADRINKLTEALVTNYNAVTEQFYTLNIDLIAESTQSYIILVDVNGNIVSCSENTKPYIMANSIDIKEFSEVLEGRNVVKTGVYNSMFNSRILTVASPLIKDGKTYGVVLFNTYQPFLNSDVASLLMQLLISILIGLVVAFILTYFLSKNMSKPIRGLSLIANNIAKGDFDKRVLINSNILEIQELSNSFNLMADSLQNHENVRSSFVSNVSHDLRTPITTIGGFVNGILDGTIPPESQNKYLTVVSKEISRLSNLINTFLDISKYEDKNVELKLTSVDINEMVRVVLLTFEKIIQQKNITVNFLYGEENTFALADEQSIHRVIVNLIDNATKFAQNNGIIDISVNTTYNKIMVGISNTGETISEQDAKYIWDRFYKTDKSRNYNKTGAGLGLYIVKSIINQHGESIKVIPGNNYTKFVFTLKRIKK